jgi:hypothetical protein
MPLKENEPDITKGKKALGHEIIDDLIGDWEFMRMEPEGCIEEKKLPEKPIYNILEPDFQYKYKDCFLYKLTRKFEQAKIEGTELVFNHDEFWGYSLFTPYQNYTLSDPDSWQNLDIRTPGRTGRKYKIYQLKGK